jgi:hypothetical protein
LDPTKSDFVNENTVKHSFLVLFTLTVWRTKIVSQASAQLALFPTLNSKLHQLASSSSWST